MLWEKGGGNWQTSTSLILNEQIQNESELIAPDWAWFLQRLFSSLVPWVPWSFGSLPLLLWLLVCLVGDI